MSAASHDHGDPTARALAEFGLTLLQGLTSTSEGQNTLISPLGVAIIMAMAHNGASGHTREVMARGLGFDKRAPDDAIRKLTIMLRGLPKSDRLTQLYVANGLWVNAALPASASFIEASRLVFQSEIAAADFGPPVAPLINGWVNRITHSKISRVIERGDDLGDLAMVSAAYFKGFWAKGFERRLTETRAFTLEDGRQKPAAMMSAWGRYSYLEEARVQAVRLPYLGDAMSMYVFLPAPGWTVSRLIEGLTAEKLAGWFTALHKSEHDGRSIHLEMPRFKVESETTLNHALQGLGMGLAFDRKRAEFDTLCPDCKSGLHIGLVRHRTGLDVDEEGTEATAATWTGSVLDESQERIPDMLVDRPFLVAIRDDSTGGLLFLGVITEP